MPLIGIRQATDMLLSLWGDKDARDTVCIKTALVMHPLGAVALSDANGTCIHQKKAVTLPPKRVPTRNKEDVLKI